MKDTAFPINSEDITLSNLIFNDLEACSELSDSLQVQLKMYEKTTKEATEIISEQSSQMANLLNQLNLTDEMLKACDKAEKKKERKIKMLKFTRNILIAVAGLEAGYIGLKLLFSK